MKTDICIIGAGPAGLVLALQLAKAGVNLCILESSTNYNRSFRGESMQPDTISIFEELEVLDELIKHGYLETHTFTITEYGQKILSINYKDVPYKYKYVMDVPQPVLLNALLERLKKFENCTILRGATCTDLIWNTQRVTGVKYRTKDNADILNIESKLVIGADGRYSKTRKLSEIEFIKNDTTRDVLWFKIPISAKQLHNTARIMIDGPNHLILLPTFPSDYRAGVNIPKGSYSTLRQQGIETFYKLIESIDMEVGALVRKDILSWQDIHLLDIFTVKVSKWFKDGILLIGDAAHTVTPLLGQGVNLGIQDAMELAPILINASKNGNLETVDFSNFQVTRQKDVDFVLNFQLRQEKLLHADTKFQQVIRRTSYKIMDKLPILHKKISNRIAYKRQIQHNLYLPE